MDTQEAIRQLSDILRHGDRFIGTHQLFTKWHENAMRVLSRVFGDHSPELRRFQAIYDDYWHQYNTPKPRGTGEQGLKYYRLDASSRCTEELRTIIHDLGSLPPADEAPPVAQSSTRIFVGRGRGTTGKDLRDFLEARLGLGVDEYDRVSVVGKTTVERVAEMLDSADFAVLITTAEDDRQIVSHEIGLFQGRLGFDKAIVLVEEGCEAFSDSLGVVQIRFPKDDVMAKSEDVRRVLENHGLLG